MTDHATRVDNWLSIPLLRLLVGVAEHGSLSSSARANGIAQSNASRAIKRLERRLEFAPIG